MNRDKARELLEKELRIRPTVKASAIFTGKNGSMGFRAGRFYAVTIVKRRGEVASGVGILRSPSIREPLGKISPRHRAVPHHIGADVARDRDEIGAGATLLPIARPGADEAQERLLNGVFGEPCRRMPHAVAHHVRVILAHKALRFADLFVPVAHAITSLYPY